MPGSWSVGRLVAVSVTHAVKPDGGGDPGVTGIDKRPVPGRVAVRAQGLAGDRVMDTRHHGGRDKAVYVYAAEDLDAWSRRLVRELVPGMFGENLTTAGVEVTHAVIGERWQVGDAVLEVTMPRIPCATFQRHLGEPRWVKRFAEQGAPGAYCRVVTEGTVAAGDPVALLHRPAHGVTLREVFHARDADPVRLARLLDVADLAPPVGEAVRRALRAARAG